MSWMESKFAFSPLSNITSWITFRKTHPQWSALVSHYINHNSNLALRQLQEVPYFWWTGEEHLCVSYFRIMHWRFTPTPIDDDSKAWERTHKVWAILDAKPSGRKKGLEKLREKNWTKNPTMVWSLTHIWQIMKAGSNTEESEKNTYPLFQNLREKDMISNRNINSKLV